MTELGQAVEWNAVPNPTAPPAPEQTGGDNVRDRCVGRAIVRQLREIRLDDAEAMGAPQVLALGVSRDARVRARVDQNPSGFEDSVNLA
jgi:hypothetical protein